ncbi:MAG: MFS transporter [Microbacteriaceae bacterium]|nr:MFS transporter [Microbacteriaceae bacterium]
MKSKYRWVVLAVLILAYAVAVMHRTSMGVASVAAGERFVGSAALLSSIGAVQVIVYGCLQIPVGILLDRFGARIMLLSGTLLMTAGQILLALTPDVGIAIFARGLVGAGDAGIFISVIRVITSWFPYHQVPFVQQIATQIGQLGQFISVIPFALVLNTSGWESAFLWISFPTLVVGLLILAFVRNRPKEAEAFTGTISLSRVSAQVLVAFKHPGTRVGFWANFVGQASWLVFGLFWGVPFMVQGLGYDPTFASSLLTIGIFSGIILGPFFGILSAKYPFRRSTLILTFITLTLIAWVIVLAWADRPPVWMIGVLISMMALAGAATMASFDVARYFNPRERHGVSTGIVNTGPSLAGFITMLGMGFVLDIVSGERTSYNLFDFKIAFIVLFVVMGVGLIGLFSSRRKARARLFAEEGIKVDSLLLPIKQRLERKS